MKGKHSLKKTGLSLSQAQSISNLCNQKSLEINRALGNISNFSRTINMPNGDKLPQVVAKSIPTNIVEILSEKSQLHAIQAFLMENIKAKDTLLGELSMKRFIEPSDIKVPERPEYIQPETMDKVEEDWGWNQLTEAEYQEYLEVEAYAAHIGQFIHKGGKLDYLRNELVTTDLLQWIDIQDGVKTPVVLETCHTSEQLMDVHEKLSSLHRKYEQRVNYFKAKVKNMVTDENASRNKTNANLIADANNKNQLLRNQYQSELDKYVGEVEVLQHEFESQKEKDIKELSQLRISVPDRFKTLIDEMLKTID